MNNKIALEALKLAGFQNPTAIAEILNYVPNPDVALEMVLGIHEPKIIDEENKFRKYKYSEEKYAEITGYDELGNTVMYNVYTQNTVKGYAITEEDYKNNTLVFERPSKYYHTKDVPTTGYTTRPDSSTIEEFGNHYPTIVSSMEMFEVFNKWRECGSVTENNMAF